MCCTAPIADLSFERFGEMKSPEVVSLVCCTSCRSVSPKLLPLSEKRAPCMWAQAT